MNLAGIGSPHGPLSSCRPIRLRRNAGVEHIGVRPMLVHPAPRVAPIVEHLAAQRVAADAPEMFIPFLLHVLVADHDVVDVGRFVGQVVQSRLVAADAEKGVVIDVLVAAVEAVERADDVVLAVGVDIVGAAQADNVAVPAERLLELRRVDHEVADPLDMRRAALDASVIKLVAALRLVFAGVDRAAASPEFSPASPCRG